MGIDPIKQKAAPSVPKTVGAKPAEAAKGQSVHPPPEAKRPGEGFDLLKKKLMSVSGRYVAPKLEVSERADLKDLVSGQRRAAQAGGTASLVGAQLSSSAGSYGVNTQPPPKKTPTGQIPKASWQQPEKIVGQLTQNSAQGGVTDSSRCGPSAILGAMIMQGPEAAAGFLEKASETNSRRLAKAEGGELGAIAGRIREGKASFEDLNHAQELLYRCGNTRSSVRDLLNEIPRGSLSQKDGDELTRLIKKGNDGKEWTDADAKRMSGILTTAHGRPIEVRKVDAPNSPGKKIWVATNPDGLGAVKSGGGLDDNELDTLVRAGKRGTQTVRTRREDSVPLQATLDRLKPGETAIVRVAGTDEGSIPDHFVTLGRTPEGRPYIYNPDPDQGDPTLCIGDPKDPQPGAFKKELGKYFDRANLLDENNTLPNITIIKNAKPD